MDTFDERLVLLAGNVFALRSLAEEGDDGHARVTADDSDVDLFRVDVLDLPEEARRSDDIEGGDAEYPTQRVQPRRKGDSMPK